MLQLPTPFDGLPLQVVTAREAEERRLELIQSIGEILPHAVRSVSEGGREQTEQGEMNRLASERFAIDQDGKLVV